MLLDEWCGTLYNGWELTSYDSKHTVICLIGPPRHGTVAEKTVTDKSTVGSPQLLQTAPYHH